MAGHISLDRVSSVDYSDRRDVLRCRQGTNSASSLNGVRRCIGKFFRMDFRKQFAVKPGAKVRLAKIDPSYAGKYETHEEVRPEIQKHVERINRLQFLLYADRNQSVLVVLQALDAGGKDGVIRHVFSGMNPQGTSVFGFKQPSKDEAAHDFLWRAHLRTPGKGEVVIFNRSYYEDVLVVRVHKLVPHSVWSKRYDLINDFETMLSLNRTAILKFYLHISPRRAVIALQAAA
jgi:polyphosphate kinase 2 (PPK2 family)